MKVNSTSKNENHLSSCPSCEAQNQKGPLQMQRDRMGDGAYTHALHADSTSAPPESSMLAGEVQRRIARVFEPNSGSTSHPIQRKGVIQMVTGAWQTYLLTLASYSSDLAKKWEPRLEAAEKARVPPPRQTEHASGSGSGDQGNKAGQMSAALEAWWSQNSAAIVSGQPQASTSGKSGKGQHHTPAEQKASANRKEQAKKDRAAAKKAEWLASQRR